MQRGILWVVSAPSGAGKTSLVRALRACDPRLCVVTSYTTRAPRRGEQNGEHYHFVGPEQFAELVQQGHFLEYATVFDYSYGTPQKAVEQTLAEGGDVLLEIDWQGAQQVAQRMALESDYPCRRIFIWPPSLAELERRLRGRQQDSEDRIKRRLKEASIECAQAKAFDYWVVNADFAQAVEDLKHIIAAERLAVRAGSRPPF